MLLGFLGRQDLVKEEDARWLFDTFAWSLRNFDRDVFFDETILVVPDNEHFAGRAQSVPEMAELIFDHVRRYAGMQHWPLHLAHGNSCSLSPPTELRMPGDLRGAKALARSNPNASEGVALAYDPELVSNPEALIASFAHALAHYLGQSAAEPPPGGPVYWPQATEVLAVFMGFGLMFANSAFSVPARSCGSCGGPQAQRRSFLTQYESTYALAIFSVLKGIPEKNVARRLKKHLRPFYRKCLREITRRTDALDRLAATAGTSEAIAAPDAALTS